MAYYIDGYDTVKFKLSNYKEKFDTIPEFHNKVVDLARELMKSSIHESDNIRPIEENPTSPELPLNEAGGENGD